MKHIFWTADERLNSRKILAVSTQLKQLRKESLKKFRIERDSNPWPLRCRRSAPPTAIKPTWSWSYCEFVIYPWRMNKWIWIYETYILNCVLKRALTDRKRVYRNTKTLFHGKRIDLSTCTLVRLLFVIRSSLKIMLKKPIQKKKKTTIGESGYWSRYLAHAKQALYHLS